MTHTLYIVGTPIGNLEDVTPHALRVLERVGVIASENPLRTRRLLDRYGIETPMVHFTDAYDRRKEARLQAVLEALDRGDVALVSEAGMPLVADPGYELVHACLARGGQVVAVAGPTALTAALIASGLPTSPFIFLGFVPRKPAARRALLEAYVHDERTLVLYEAPTRLLDTLRDARAVLGERLVAVGCELTKLYEEMWRGELSGAIAYLEAEEPRGEYVVVIGPGSAGGNARLRPGSPGIEAGLPLREDLREPGAPTEEDGYGVVGSA
jgi:16S rRNA (cytidine1402-2'-O)-methyltransferase